MAFIASTPQFQSARSTALRALFEQERIKYGNNLAYKEIGFGDEDARTIDQDLYSSIVGSGEPMLTAEKQKYAEGDLFESYKVTPVLKKFTNTLAISEEMDRFDLSQGKLVKKQVTQIALSTNRKINKLAFGILDQGWNTTQAVGGDGLALFHTAHPMSPTFSTFTQSNIVNTAAGNNPILTYDTYGAALLQMSRFRDGRNEEGMIEPDVMLVGPENLPEALRIFDSQDAPETANNDVNVYKTYGRQRIVVSKFIDYSPATPVQLGKGKWFLIDTKIAPDMLKISWGWRPRVNNRVEYANGTELYFISTMLAPFFADWRAVIGSNATGI